MVSRFVISLKESGSPPVAPRRHTLRSRVAAFFLAAAMTDDRQARRRQLGAARQARYRANHRGETATLQIPRALHAVIRHRARTAGLSVPKFLQLLTGTRT